MIQFDINIALLHDKLKEKISMKQPKGYYISEWSKKQIDGSYKEMPIYVYLLLKAIYGLKQTSRVWSKLFDKFLVAFDLIPITADSCVYIRKKALCCSHYFY
jgi:hypothetical protein